LTSFNQLVHELIAGGVRRHKFSLHEMDLLLDLNACRIRKSAQPEMLRRYLKAVQQHAGDDGGSPMRLSFFIQAGTRKRVSADSCERESNFAKMEPGLSSK
jgi:hypothetical protein